VEDMASPQHWGEFLVYPTQEQTELMALSRLYAARWERVDPERPFGGKCIHCGEPVTTMHAYACYETEEIVHMDCADLHIQWRERVGR